MMPTPTVARRTAERRAHLMRELVEVLIFVAIVFAAVSTTQSFSPSDTSMAPALNPGEHVVVNKAAYLLGGPSRGDVVLLADPADTSMLLMRRVIAVPGDHVVITATTVEVNGVSLHESAYTHIDQGQPESPTIGKWTLGQGQYFVLADNRFGVVQSATDSRFFGPVVRSNIIGRAEVVYWPIRKFHWVNAYPSVFSNVPNN